MPLDIQKNSQLFEYYGMYVLWDPGSACYMSVTVTCVNLSYGSLIALCGSLSL